MGDEETAATPWERGRIDEKRGPAMLLFGQMFEDPEIELAAFPPGGRILCIASAGCTALALSDVGFEVTAVDVNPAQIEYVRRRLDGGAVRAGAVDRLLELGRTSFPLIGFTRSRLETFLMMEDPDEQIHYWREHLDTARWRVALRLALSGATLRTRYGNRFVRALPEGFAGVMARRLERTWSTHPNRTNPYAWRLFLGEEPPGASSVSRLEVARSMPTLVHAEVTRYLDSRPAGSFDGFSLSNIPDGADALFRARLIASIERAAAPGATVVLRSFQEPVTAEEEHWSVRDRSILWGAIRVERVRDGSVASR